MKIVVEKTKPGMFENEYRITLPEKTKEKLRKVALFTAIFGPATYFVLGGPLPSKKTTNDPETTESD